jgi:regulator of sigma E protease
MIVSLAFMLGAPVSPDSYPQYTNEIKNVRVIVLDVDHGSPADKAGIKIGDSITSVNGKNITDPSSEVASIRERIDGTKGVPILLNNISVTPLKGEHPELPDMYAVGISMDIAGTLRLPPLTAVKEGWKFVWYMITSTFGVIGALITGLFHADNTVLSHVTGPIGIAGEVGNAVHIGFTYLLMLTALISVNLAVLNLVPFPALDGGRILFVGIESIIRKQIKPSIANAVNAIGFILLMILMVVVAYHDIVTKVLGK